MHTETVKKRHYPLDILIYFVIVALAITLIYLLSPADFRTLIGRNQLSDVPAGSVKNALQNLTVREDENTSHSQRPPQSQRIPQYQRAAFGPAWEDTDRNGCDTRNDILARDLQAVEFKKTRPRNCVVLRGILDDPYTGRRVEFQRGPDTSDVVQIDHVVALADAWRAGAYAWDARQRLEFANDPQNLLAVVGFANEDKGRSRADEWLPADERFHCAYVARQVRVKARWGLSVTEGERTAFIRVLASCPVLD